MEKPCPRCYRTVTGKDQTCPHCGLDMTLYRELNRLNALASELSESIRKASDRLMMSLPATREQLAGNPELEREPEPKREPERETEREPESVPMTESMPAKPQAKAEQKAAQHKKPGQTLIQEAGMGQMWLLIAGIGVTVLGVAFFLKHAFDQNWIGPAGRVALAYSGGALFLGLGEWLRKKYAALGLSLLGGGIAVLYLATYTGNTMHMVIGPATAFLLMILITALAGLLSVYYNAYWLSLLGTLGGFATPILVDSENPAHLVYLSYILILNGGILLVSFFRHWPSLHRVAFFFTWILFSAWKMSSPGDAQLLPSLVFLTLAYIIFMIAPYAYYIRNTDRLNLAGLGITIPNGLIAFAYSQSVLEDLLILANDQAVILVDYASAALAIAYAMLPLSLATHFFRKRTDQIGKQAAVTDRAFDILLLQGMLFLALMVPFLVSFHWYSLFWAIQAIGIFYISLRLRNSLLALSSILVQAMAVLVFFTMVTENPWLAAYRGQQGLSSFSIILIAHLTQAVFVIGFLFAASPVFSRYRNERQTDQKPFLLEQIHRAYPVAGIMLLFSYLSLELSYILQTFSPGSVQAGLSVLWGGFAIALIGTGIARRIRALRLAGIFLFAITAIKLLALDMSGVDAPYRILSFIAIGLVMILSSYLYYRFRDRLLEENKQ